MARRTPAATAEPMTPATFGPIACINRKFCGFACRPILLATRAAIGTAETPAAPINGLTDFPVTRYMILPMTRPAAVPIENATMPSSKMPRVSALKNLSAASLEPTESPRKIVTILINSLSGLRERWPIRDKETLNAILDGLRIAGLPE